eukprot:353811-Hanusia_phi.AAC.4
MSYKTTPFSNTTLPLDSVGGTKPVCGYAVEPAGERGVRGAHGERGIGAERRGERAEGRSSCILEKRSETLAMIDKPVLRPKPSVRSGQWRQQSMCERALMFRSLFICLLLLSPLLSCDGARGSNDHGIMQGRYDLSWESPGNSSRDSMPIGNGDFAANVWTEKTSGDVVVLLAKSNSWSEEARLLKLGELRVSLYPRQELGEGSWFSQKLHLSNASISISTRDVKVCVWIHALTNRLEVSVSSQRKTKVRAALRIWRNETRKFRRGEEGGAYGCNCREHVLRPDVIHEDDGDATVLWYHRNGNETCYVQGLALEGIVAAEDPLRYLTSGGSLEGTSSSGSTGISFVKRSGNEKNPPCSDTSSPPSLLSLPPPPPPPPLF